MTKIAYFDCFSGISGDMAVAAFLDAGLDMGTLTRELGKLKIKGYKIKKMRVLRGELFGTKFDCLVKERAQVRRSLKEIISLIDKSSLSKRTKALSKDIFAKIGAAEARVHRRGNKRDVYLHELGEIDSIVDIVGVAIAIDKLGIDEVHSSNIVMGRTFVKSHHGNWPIPSPASLELLKGTPLKISELDAELVTPTGAGILRSLSKGFGEVPQMEVSSIGYGAGALDLSTRPNMLRVIIGRRCPSFKEDRICVIETNIDDMNPQCFEYIIERLFKAGAMDVYITPIQMKGSRPASKLTVLIEPSLLNRISSIIFSETTTFGIRFYEANRFKLERKFVKVLTRYGDVDVKLGSGPDGVFSASPEYEECVRLAKDKKVPLKVIYDEAKMLATKVRRR